MISTIHNHNHPSLLDSEPDSDTSPTAAGAEGGLRHNDLSDTIFRSYIELTGHSSPDLSKIQSFLTSSRSEALSYLICLECIRLSDPTWSCSSRCFVVFHLLCIQSLAHQSSDLSASRATSRLPISASRAAEDFVWNCPKCRVNYPKTLIPRKYLYFCQKLEDPPSDPWILPHSCGEVCNRPLKHNCGHYCLLLCHLGHCPSCPKLVKSHCFCGAVEDVRRCGFKNFSCNGVCSKLLDCGTHRCGETCHEGDCPPCQAWGVYRCQYGKVEEKRECCDRNFQCEVPYQRLLSCEKHLCSRGCHWGECGECPLQGKRTCSCGKRAYEGIACDVPLPLCGSTCDKMLSCGFHRCPERCHRGPCIETCRVVVTKSCRCGSLRKEICDRRLRCKNHKCPAPCHRGVCAPCPVMVTISCACGETHFEVPCGTEKEQKPPRCPKPCCIIPLCRHGPNCKPHKCHYGACPSCRLICEEEYPCGHNCKLRCHGPKPPPNPEFTLKPKKKKSKHHSECIPGSPCPPCPELMVCSNIAEYSCNNLCGNLLPCGNHYCTKVCHALKSQSSSLGRHGRGEFCEECDLPCQKERQPACPHPCPQPCHRGECPPCKVLIRRSCHCGSMVQVFECLYYNSMSENEQMTVRSCGRPCHGRSFIIVFGLERQPACPHPCPRPCHRGECPPCKVLIRRSCHCGSMVHVFECLYYNSKPEKEQMTVRSCRGPCHRKLPYCTHLCPEICHPGQCPAPEKCSEKVTVRCGCQTLKKEWLCHDVQAAYRSARSDLKDISKNQYGLGLLPCNSGCRSKVKVADTELQHRKSTVLKDKEADAENYVPKRRKRRERAKEAKQISRLQKFTAAMWRLLLFVTLVLALIAATYYGYKGLLWLSDCMNEVEVQRQRRRHP